MALCFQGRASFILVASAPWYPSSSSLSHAGKPFKSTQTPPPAQRNKINNIQHAIALVAKLKSAYILNQNNSIPEQTKYNKCTFTALTMTP
jgi:hypothetical protein